MVLLISYICDVVLVELKLLQIFCNRSVKKKIVVCKTRWKKKKKKKKRTYSGGQKAPLKVHIL